MKLILLFILLVLSSCAIAPPEVQSQPLPKRKAERIEDCAERFYRLGMTASEAIEICREAHK